MISNSADEEADRRDDNCLGRGGGQTERGVLIELWRSGGGGEKVVVGVKEEGAEECCILSGSLASYLSSREESPCLRLLFKLTSTDQFPPRRRHMRSLLHSQTTN